MYSQLKILFEGDEEIKSYKISSKNNFKNIINKSGKRIIAYWLYNKGSIVRTCYNRSYGGMMPFLI